ncbi:MAG: hypothetical protein M5U01_00660 [Ardenticatenaceae bacterium]|nr:hypothetical protein [Ardenticatenaceae bacterium]
MDCPNCGFGELPEDARSCPVYREGLPTVPSIDVTKLIAGRTQDFTGRAWVFRRRNAWLETGTSRVFLLAGGPGTGKSALAARVAGALVAKGFKGQRLERLVRELGLQEAGATVLTSTG